MKKKYWIALVVVIAIFVVGFFVFKQAPKSNSEPITIGIITYPGFGTFYIAQEQGLFKKYGVNVELTQIAGDAALPSLASGKTQMSAITTTDTMPVIADSGIAAKQIFSTSKSNGADGLAVRNDIKTLKDLKGKKVYVMLGFPDHFLMRNLQTKAGIPFEDIELVHMDAELAASAFIAGNVNAAWTWEPYLSKTKERKDGHILVTSKDEPNLMADDIVIARNDLVATRREDVKNIMRAFFEAEAWWSSHLAEGDAIVAKAFNISSEEFTPTREHVALSDLATNLKKFDKSTPWNMFEQANRASEVYLKDGIIKANVDADSVTDASLLQELK